MGRVLTFRRRRRLQRGSGAYVVQGIDLGAPDGDYTAVRLDLPGYTLAASQESAVFAGTVILAALDSGMSVGQLKDLGRTLAAFKRTR